MMRTSKHGIELLRQVEGVEYRAYTDSAGHATIGVGHKILPGEEWLRTATLNDSQVNAILANDLRTAEAAVLREFPKVKRQNQFDALVSFVFNLGEGATDRGTLDELINSNAPAETISAKWMQYVNAGGHQVEGLRKRRALELQLYWRHLWASAVLCLLLAGVLLVAAGINTATA